MTAVISSPSASPPLPSNYTASLPPARIHEKSSLGWGGRFMQALAEGPGPASEQALRHSFSYTTGAPEIQAFSLNTGTLTGDNTVVQHP